MRIRHRVHKLETDGRITDADSHASTKLRYRRIVDVKEWLGCTAPPMIAGRPVFPLTHLP